jgi:hypothetical protein
LANRTIYLSVLCLTTAGLCLLSILLWWPGTVVIPLMAIGFGWLYERKQKRIAAAKAAALKAAPKKRGRPSKKSLLQK